MSGKKETAGCLAGIFKCLSPGTSTKEKQERSMYDGVAGDEGNDNATLYVGASGSVGRLAPLDPMPKIHEEPKFLDFKDLFEYGRIPRCGTNPDFYHAWDPPEPPPPEPEPDSDSEDEEVEQMANEIQLFHPDGTPKEIKKNNKKNNKKNKDEPPPPPPVKRGNANLAKIKGDFDAKKTMFIFVSHTWLTPEDPAAIGTRGHPDDEEGSIYALIVKTCNDLIASQAMYDDFTIALWIDYSCVDQDAPSPPPEIEQLHLIVMWCDAMLIPIHDPTHSAWHYPEGKWTDFYTQYQAPQFQAYFQRAWTASELMAASCMPLPNGEKRASYFKPKALQLCVGGNRRLLMVFGTKELVMGKPFLVMPPPKHRALERMDPVQKKISFERDRPMIEKIAWALSEFVNPLEEGYRGEVDKQGRAHGKGTYVHAARDRKDAGDVFEGEYKEGKEHGWGKYVYGDGDVYEGDYVDGIKEGKGTYKFASGNVYVGQFHDGEMHGKGRYKYKDGAVYEGEFAEGVKNGIGTYMYADGAIYEGQWKNGDMDGKGTYTYRNGIVYEGEWKADKKHGWGRIKYLDGGVYDGEWKDNKKDGNGTYKHPNGNIYIGEWREDKKRGKGKLTHVDGSVYDGDFKDDRKNGWGICTYKNMAVYEGEWVNDRKEGRGNLHYPDGDVYEGSWKDDKKNGGGLYKYANGAVYGGEWRNDMKTGKGTLQYPSGKVDQGEWEDDEFLRFAQIDDPYFVTEVAKSGIDMHALRIMHRT